MSVTARHEHRRYLASGFALAVALLTAPNARAHDSIEGGVHVATEGCGVFGAGLGAGVGVAAASAVFFPICVRGGELKDPALGCALLTMPVYGLGVAGGGAGGYALFRGLAERGHWSERLGWAMATVPPGLLMGAHLGVGLANAFRVEATAPKVAVVAGSAVAVGALGLLGTSRLRNRNAYPAPFFGSVGPYVLALIGAGVVEGLTRKNEPHASAASQIVPPAIGIVSGALLTAFASAQGPEPRRSPESTPQASRAASPSNVAP